MSNCPGIVLLLTALAGGGMCFNQPTNILSQVSSSDDCPSDDPCCETFEGFYADIQSWKEDADESAAQV